MNKTLDHLFRKAEPINTNKTLKSAFYCPCLILPAAQNCYVHNLHCILPAGSRQRTPISLANKLRDLDA